MRLCKTSPPPVFCTRMDHVDSSFRARDANAAVADYASARGSLSLSLSWRERIDESTDNDKFVELFSVLRDLLHW